LIAATGNSVAPYWPSLFASNLGKDIDNIIFSRGAGAPVSAAAVVSGGGDAKKPEEKKEEKKPKVEEVDALEGGMDMFGGAKDY